VRASAVPLFIRSATDTPSNREISKSSSGGGRPDNPRRSWNGRCGGPELGVSVCYWSRLKLRRLSAAGGVSRARAAVHPVELTWQRSPNVASNARASFARLHRRCRKPTQSNTHTPRTCVGPPLSVTSARSRRLSVRNQRAKDRAWLVRERSRLARPADHPCAPASASPPQVVRRCRGCGSLVILHHQRPVHRGHCTRSLALSPRCLEEKQACAEARKSSPGRAGVRAQIGIASVSRAAAELASRLAPVTCRSPFLSSTVPFKSRTVYDEVMDTAAGRRSVKPPVARARPDAAAVTSPFASGF
jgi:hypothetical protein